MGCERMWSCVHVMWSVVYVACGAAQLVAGIFFILGIPSWVLGCNLLTGSYNILMGIGVGMVACCGQVTPRRQETLLYMTVSILMANVANIVVSEYGFYLVHIVKLMEDHQYNELIKYACFGTRGTAAVALLVSFLDSQLAFCSMQSAAVARNATGNKKQPKNLYYHHHRGAPGALGVNGAGSHEQVSDIEYIIPRQKSSSKAQQQHQQQQQQVYNAYSQSWVFDADSNNTSSTLVNPNGSLGGHSSTGDRADRADRYSVQKTRQPLTSYHHHQHPQYQHPQYYDGIIVAHSHSHGGDVVRGKQLIAKGAGLDCGLVVADSSPRRVRGLLIDNPNPAVQIDEAVSVTDSTNSNNSDRKLCYMKSFSRSASPAPLSASSSQTSLQHNGLYECNLAALAPPQTKPHHNQVVIVRGANSTSTDVTAAATPLVEKVQYASLMKELQNAIVTKSKTSSSRQEESASITSSKNSDAEFSKELEAALQLIQDLESPNTIDTTPSERNLSGSDSDKTLSATGSLTELCNVQTVVQQSSDLTRHGKGTTRIFVPNNTTHQHNGGSQSTSGYSSPTRGNKNNSSVWSTTSSLNGSSPDLPPPLTYSIHNTQSTAVISLYAPPAKSKSITLVNITNPIDVHDSFSSSSTLHNNINTCPGKNHNDHSSSKHSRTESSASSVGSSVNIWSVKSLLRKKKTTTPPKLCPELEEAIIKSESLAYLSELELVARHERNASIHRQIEQKVHQQLSIPRTSSNC